MIKPGEIQNKAREIGVRDQQIEKDYILSWILKGISQHKQLSKILVFKGGTVLKKIYFADYRFSEDLDFTLIDSEISNKQIFEWFQETFEYIKEEANIPLEIIDDNEHEDGGINCYINYIDPLGGFGNQKSVKVDISRSEKLEFEPLLKPAIIVYSDIEEYELLCYTLEELIVEKLRCIMQWMQPRDYYDIWYLLEIHGMDVDFYINEFISKCESKNLNPTNFQKKLAQKIPSYKARWQRSMNEQIKDLPDFDQVQREVHRHLKKWMVE